MKIVTTLLSLASCVSCAVGADSVPVAGSSLLAERPWLDVSKPVAERVRLLENRLDLREKISLLYWLAPAIDRLGIPEYHHGNEALHGLVRPGDNTVFPQAIGLGATFDPELVHAMATAISDEARARWNASGGRHLGALSDVLTLWSPVVNMARDPRWGRTQETYGEDPWLTSRMGVAFVKGLQGDDPHYLKAIATPKHFAANNEEAGRFGKNILCDERYLFEYELFPFRACVQEAHAQSIMASYTAINGVPSAANAWLLTEVLRHRWGFDGYVVSDCGAISNLEDQHHYVASPEAAIAASLNAGLDLEGGWYCKYPDVVNVYMPGALQKGLVREATVDQALARVLTGRFKLGMFDPADKSPWAGIPESVIGSPAHAALARKAADEAIVLLKNNPAGGAPLLPLDPARVKKIAVVGPNAEALNFGDYSGHPKESATALQGLQERAEKAGINIISFPWLSGNLELVPSTVLVSDTPGVSGLTAKYFASGDLTGTPAGIRVDGRLNFDWAHIEPDPLASAAKFSVEWTGKIKIPKPGDYVFRVTADGGVNVFFDHGKVLNHGKEKNAKRQVWTWVSNFQTAGEHDLKVEYRHDGGDTGFVLEWTPPADHTYLPSLRDADAVVAVMGTSTLFEIEGKDRPTLRLPVEQEEFLTKLAAINPRIVLVLESGSSLALPDSLPHIPAMVEAWFPGQEGGRAIADVLFGDVNPAGRLPLTFYADDAQLRPMTEYDLTKGRTYLYLESKPGYAFGHGLSYTTFRYSPLKLNQNRVKIGDKIEAEVEVANTGGRDGDEVVQGYVAAKQSSVPMPKRQLWSFQRVTVPKGETRRVTLTFDTANFGHWDQATQQFIVEPGDYEIQIGAASDDIRQTAPLHVESGRTPSNKTK